jgi:hypothetical protein
VLFKQHSDKTFIGKLEKGFDWLGYQFNQKGLCGAASRALENYAAKLRRLYEQARRLGLNTPQTELRVAQYRKRWQQWLQAGLHQLADPGNLLLALHRHSDICGQGDTCR